MYIVAVLLTLIGIFAMRWNVVIGGQLFSKSFLGYTSYKLDFITREGILVAAGLTILPLIILTFLLKLLPPGGNDHRNSQLRRSFNFDEGSYGLTIHGWNRGTGESVERNSKFVSEAGRESWSECLPTSPCERSPVPAVAPEFDVQLAGALCRCSEKLCSSLRELTSCGR